MSANIYYLSANGCLNLSNGQLAEGTASATIQLAAAVDYAIGEQLYSKAITDDIAMTACAQQAAGTSCVYSICINAVGDVVVAKGTEQVTGSEQPLTWANIPDHHALLGAVKVNTATNAFISGTTDLSDAGVTATFYNYMTPPSFTLQA